MFPNFFNEKGIYFPLLAILILPLLVLCGLVIDGGSLYITHLRVQRAVDAGAMRALPILIAANEEKGNTQDAPTAAQYVANSNLQLYGYGANIQNITAALEPSAPAIPNKVNITATVFHPYQILQFVPGFPNGSPVTATAVAGKPSLLIALVLDTTGSMRDGDTEMNGVPMKKIKALGLAALDFYNGLEGQYDEFIAVHFSEDAETLVGFGKTPSDIRYQLGRIGRGGADGIPGSGSTNISMGLKAVNNMLEQHPEFSSYRRHVVVMTDGIPNHIGNAYVSLKTTPPPGAFVSPGAVAPLHVSACGHPVFRGGVDPNAAPEAGPVPVTLTRVASDILRRRGMNVTVHAVGFGYYTTDAKKPNELTHNECIDPNPNANPSLPPDPFEGSICPGPDQEKTIIPALIRRIANHQRPGDPDYINHSSFPVLDTDYCNTQEEPDLECGQPGHICRIPDPDCFCKPRIGPEYPVGAAIYAGDGDELKEAFTLIRDAILRDSTLIE